MGNNSTASSKPNINSDSSANNSNNSSFINIDKTLKILVHFPPE